MLTTTLKTLCIVSVSLLTAQALPISALAGSAGLSNTADRIQLAQTQGMDNRQDRRDDRQDDRGDRQDTRQDCRQGEGVAGADKRDCKQDGRQDRNSGG